MAQRRCRSFQMLACMIFASAPAVVRTQPVVASAQEIVGSWLVEYRTTALRVEAVEEGLPKGNARLVTVKLRNISGRPITAIAIDVENGHGRFDVGWSGTPLKPGGTTNFETNNSVAAEPYRHVRLNAVLFADKQPDDGEPSAAQSLRLARVAALLEESRCLAVLTRLDQSPLDEARITAVLASVGDAPRTIEEALASLPEDPQLSFASHERIRNASSGARQAFLNQIQVQRDLCKGEIRNLTQVSGSSTAERPLRSELQRSRLHHQKNVDALRPFCERDMEVEQ